MPDYVFGTADELRRLADLADQDSDLPAKAVAWQEQRVAALQARYPGTPLASLAGRILCADPAETRGWGTRPRGCWHRLTNQADGTITADVYLYGEVGWEIMAGDVIQQLGSITATDVTVHLNSPGGDVFEGQAIRNQLLDYPARIEMRVDALAASIASVIAMAGDRIVMNRQARMMVHDASGLVIGDADDMRAMAEVLDAVSDDIAAVYAARAGGTTVSWRDVMRAETWFSAEETVAAGLADEAIPNSRPGADEDAAADSDAESGSESPAGTAVAARVHVPAATRPPHSDPAAAAPKPVQFDTMAAAFAAVYGTPTKEAAL